MILTGKCLNDFLKWSVKNYGRNLVYDMKYWNEEDVIMCINSFLGQKHYTIEAIKKANDIYNGI